MKQQVFTQTFLGKTTTRKQIITTNKVLEALFVFSDSKTKNRMGEDEDGGVPAKRRRAFTRRETLEKLEELEGNVAAVVGEIYSTR